MFPSSSTAPATAPVRLQLIGDFEVCAGLEPVRVRRCGQKLLAFLALSRSAVARPVLAGTLWPESPGSQAAANLRSAVSRLPRPLGRQLVKSVGNRMALAEDLLVDLYGANALIQSPARPTGPAPGNWCADLLTSWDEDWVLLERERYRQARLHALEKLSEQLREQRRYGEAMQVALDALSGEPLRETAHRLIIEVHLAEGNAAEALRQYHLYRELLRSEMGLAPSAGLRHLVRPLLERPED
jgi:DNA-binding SARP family transcriptional activator